MKNLKYDPKNNILSYDIDGTTNAINLSQLSIEAVHHPRHYTIGCAEETRAIVALFVKPELLDEECIDAMERSGLIDFCLCSAVKYLWRAGQKGDRIEDLEKAAWYLDRWLHPKSLSLWRSLQRWVFSGQGDDVYEAIEMLGFLLRRN